MTTRRGSEVYMYPGGRAGVSAAALAPPGRRIASDFLHAHKHERILAKSSSSAAMHNAMQRTLGQIGTGSAISSQMYTSANRYGPISCQMAHIGAVYDYALNMCRPGRRRIHRICSAALILAALRRRRPGRHRQRRHHTNRIRTVSPHSGWDALAIAPSHCLVTY